MCIHCLHAGLLAALDLARLGAVDVVGGDPVGIVGCSGGDGGVGGLLNNGCLGTLRAASGTLLTSLATLTLLREVGSDPDVVGKVDGTTKASQEEEVEEDARDDQSMA